MPSPVSPGSTAALRQRAPRLAEAAVERARLTVVPRAHTRAARVPFVSLVTLLLLGGVVGLLLFNTSMQQSSFTATSLEQRATLLSAREESLGMQLENLRDPQVVARKAQQLGMRVPAAPLFLDLSDGSVEGDPVGARVVAPVLLDPRPAARPSLLDPPATVVRPAEGVLSDGRGDAAAAERGGRNGAEVRAERRAEKQAEKKAQQKAERLAEKKAEKKAEKQKAKKKAEKQKAKKKAEKQKAKKKAQRARKNRDA